MLVGGYLVLGEQTHAQTDRRTSQPKSKTKKIDWSNFSENMAGMIQHQQISEAQQAYDTFWPKVGKHNFN